MVLGGCFRGEWMWCGNEVVYEEDIELEWGCE